MKLWFERFTVSRGKPRTLFAWFLAGFAVNILLFSSFTLFSVLFFSDRVKGEVIQYNNLILSSTTDDYEKQFQLIADAVLMFSLNLDVEALNKKNVDYTAAMETRTVIQGFVNNASLHIDNLILCFRRSGLTLDKTKGSSIDEYFSRFLYHPDIETAYWHSRLEQKEPVVYMPTATFTEFDGNGGEVARYRRMPIVIRNNMIPDLVIIALVDADRMYNSFYRSINDNFYIRNAAGQLIYSPANAENGNAAVASADSYQRTDGEYIFRKTGSYSHFTYSSVVSDDNIAAKTRWKSSFFALLVLLVLISAFMSFAFAIRLQSPVKRMLEALRRQDGVGGRPSNIREFSEIENRVQLILQSNRAIHRDLTAKNSILRQYAVIDEFKGTRNRLNRYQEMQEVQQPFRLLLFRAHYVPGFQAEYSLSTEHGAPFPKEIIDHSLKHAFPNTLTFQMENQTIIALLFGETGDDQVRAAVDGIIDSLGYDRDSCYLTIGIGLVRPASGDLTEAYESAVALLRLRKFDCPNQVIREPSPQAEQTIYTLAYEEEFNRNLEGGNKDASLQMIDKTIRLMKKRQALYAEVTEFADSLAFRIEAGCARMNFDTRELRALRTSLGDCHTYEHLKLFFDQLLKAAASLYDTNRIKRDPMIAFVFEYIEAHYGSVISLDLLADKLDISSSYLSKYFKEKTGMYFVDYVNSVRIRNVLQLLERPGAKIQEAALKVGYQNINSFNRIFKKMTGTTPSEYRLQTMTKAKDSTM